MLIRAYHRRRARTGVHLGRRSVARDTAVCFAASVARGPQPEHAGCDGSPATPPPRAWRLVVMLVAAAIGAGGGLAMPMTARAAIGLGIDQSVHTHYNCCTTTINTPVLTTATGNEAVIMFAGGDWTGNTVTSVTGAGLTFTQRVFENGQTGVAAVWSAYSVSQLVNASFAVSFAQSTSATVTVVTFQNVSSTTPIGATAHLNHAAGVAPSVSLTTTQNNSLVYGVGADVNNGIARTIGPVQTMVHEYTNGDEFWIQRATNPKATPGLVTINDTAPTTDYWDLSVVEVYAAAPASPPVVDQVVSDDSQNGAVTSPLLTTTAPNELVVVSVALGDPTGNFVVSVTGAGLGFTKAVSENVQDGDAEVWWAYSPAQLTNARIKATANTATDTSVVVVTFTGALASGPIGATNKASAPSGTAATTSLTTTIANSWVFGVGAETGDCCTPQTLGAGQTMVDEFPFTTNADDLWTQRTTAPTPSSGTVVTINETAPTTSRWDLAIVEILPNTCPISAAGACVAGQTVTQTITAGTLSVTAPANATLGAQNPGSLSAAQPLGTLSFTDTLNDTFGWSVTLAATDFGAGKIPFTGLTIGVCVAANYTAQGGSVGTPTAGTASQTLLGLDGIPGTTFSTAITLASAIAAVEGTWSTPAGGTGNTMTVLVPATSTAGTYTSTLQYTILG